ncbi:uncharacterized protein LOC130736674 [Lotus japonicus]|uniref:uncharacterized protein LOC130736674 n=1 Tax=Lotus japonicus TaxID=34305 RepID=UPI00258B6F2F|nr:uncharacterized protein LOC130736674 [Lotus japonicus]
MRILAWNCRGLGNSEAVGALRKLIHSEVPDVVFLSETRRYTTEMLRHRGMGGLQNIFPVHCEGHGKTRAGGLCLMWGSEVEDNPGVSMQVLAIYGFPDLQNKFRTWELLGGDPPDLGQLQVATQACADCGIHLVESSGYSFTWSNKRAHPATVEERSEFTRNRVKMFRFEEIWLESGEECTEIVTECWNDQDVHFLEKVGKLGQNLEAWGKAKYGDIPKRIAETKKQLQRLQREVQTIQVVSASKESEKELEELLKIEEIAWAQRSRATWLKSGDKNTRFFHTKATQRRKRNLIEEIEDANGVKFQRDVDIARVLKNYFEDIFSSSNPSGEEELASLVADRVTEAHRSILSVPFTRDEVEEALFQMHPTKAPGVDGFPALFYQKFWPIVGDDVSTFCLQVLNGDSLPGMVNQTLLVLIPKVKKAVLANQFRPISLCNVVFKIITKTIANRMKLFLSDLISETQSAFVPGRLITDNALIAYECFHYMKKKFSGKNGMMALKLDMSKAYDRVEWSFLKQVLLKMGFPINWVNLIMSCVNSVTFSIMVNGNPQPTFAPHRGLRQGDPLSPYLFILCGEVFSALIQKSILTSSLHGIKISRSAPVISHLLFADDSILFAKASVQEAECVLHILATYERASGQKINLDKSMLSVSRNVPENSFHELKQLLGVKAVESYDKYLGLPTIIGKSKSQIFRFVKERVWKKLKGWKEGTLSRAGREVLIKAVAQAIPSYVMSCFILPDGLCKEIEGMISRFFWGGDASKRSLHWLRWDKLCQPKFDGGLGFRDFKSFNLALVAKNWWRIQNNPNSLMGRVFKSVYFPSGSLSGARKGYRPSYAWSSILKTSDFISKGSAWRIGNGTTVRIWHDNWLPNGSPINYREDVVQELGLERVVDLLLPDGRGWNKELIEWTFCPATALRILAVPLPFQPQDDHMYWAGSGDGKYCVKSGYEFLRGKVSQQLSEASSTIRFSAEFWKELWKSSCLPRCKELVWRACNGALPVRGALRKRGLDVDPSCMRCGEEDESIEHVFLRCPVARACWFASDLGLRINGALPFHEFIAEVLLLHDDHVTSFSQELIYSLWKSRNKLLFEGTTDAWDSILDRARALRAPPAMGTAPAAMRSRRTASWVRPAPGLIKVNTDAALGRDKLASFGMVARNKDGLIMAAASFYPVVALSATIAEALSLRWAMTLATQLGFRRVQFEVDSLQLHQAWRRREGDSYLAMIIQDCFKLCGFFDHVDLSFTRREGNVCAHFMAKHAYSLDDVVWVEEGPPGLLPLLHDDLLASMPTF